MNLDELIRNSIFANARVIAGSKGLKNEVQTVNIMDAPDIINYLKQKEFLLSNGYFIKQSPDTLSKLIANMHAMGCSGLAVKSRRFALAISPEDLAVADRLGFPLIELSEVPFSLGEILQQSTSFILDNKNHELHYALTVHKQFSGLIMHGNGLAKILDFLSSLIASPVILLGSRLEMMERSSSLGQNALPLVTAIAAALASIPPFQTTLSLCLVDASFPECRELALHPIQTYRHEGYLVTFPLLQKEDRLTALTIEQAANVIGLEMMKRQAVKERSRRFKNEFFADLIDGYFVTEQEVLHRGKKYGLRPRTPMLLIAVRLDIASESLRATGLNSREESLQSERDIYYETLKRHFYALRLQFTMFTRNDAFGLLVQLDDTELDETELRGALEKISSDLLSQSLIGVSIGIGSPVTDPLDIGLSFKEALKALQTGYSMGKSRFVLSHRRNDVGYLLRLLPSEELRRFFDETFKGFDMLEERERQELLRTLKAYYDNHCHLIDTAKTLFVHRNTVLYRLDKCEKIVNLHLKDATESLRIRLALAIEPILKGKSV
ncbi:PucR family transcriptional regulator [Cohnella hashimotonis]|uniref:PucR family transcriptional regulator ligand-binding domain-containing protein n=1 Tax=Cohnella hashimotonis TaxID=2826895 RepID=A0ABT6T9N9_9BACL|nr:PucR family transcriptional regulator [Cohnella hashimotonis]MDI4643530.1 PucR family transcriptional regulator ligand-binding domain-containing protein [Cohnella hashimotonis]